MTDYFGTDQNDIIDASNLDPDVKNINSGAGNDTISNVSSAQEVRTSKGDDTISGSNFIYRISRGDGSQDITVNLEEGFSDDGFGTTDNISGVYSVHTYTYHNTTIYGTSNKEEFWLNGGNNVVDGGGGDDQVIYFDKKSSDYIITYSGNDVHITGDATKDILTNVRYVKFWDDNKTIDLILNSKQLRATKIEELYSFEDDTFSPAYVYNNIEYKSQLVTWTLNEAIIADINSNGLDDIVIPVSKGYGSGIDNSTPFITLTSSNGTLVFDDSANAQMPIATGARRTAEIKLVNTDHKSFVTIQHQTDAEANRNKPGNVPQPELQLIQPLKVTTTREDFFPDLPESIVATNEIIPEGTKGQKYAVDAHSMDVGDINGDGLDDIFIGHGYANGASEGSYSLIQQADGKFIIEKDDFYKKIVNWTTPGDNSNNLLLDAALVDVNNDGFDDLIAGFGTGNSGSLIFINSNGKFDENNYINIPESIYGEKNQQHMKTLSSDFNNDGDIDLAIQYTRVDPYYGGNYIQILINDGQGNFSDTTSSILGNPNKDAYKEGWVPHWQLIDFNDDGHMDIAGVTSDDENFLGMRLATGIPLIYFNDGEGRFAIDEIALEPKANGQSNVYGLPFIYSDFDNDNLIEFLVWDENRVDALGNRAADDLVKSINSIVKYELANQIGTGPDYSTDTAEKGVPGFNERYYLNENISAQEAVTAGTYDSGLAHYLAEGKDADLKTFAPFTKVHGYSGNDTIVLREGDEIAYGYAGKDTIEGGAGNDIIDGGEDLDTAIYKDTSSAYTLTANDDGTVSVVHSSPSEDFTHEGSDTLTSIEKMQFSDKTLSKTSLKYELSESIDLSENILSAHTEDVLSGTLNFNKGDNIIILDGQGKTYRGLEGDDTYFVSQLLPKNGKVSITDTEGSNLVQLPTNTYIDKSLFTKNAARLTLEDGREVTISGADKFSYNVGGNVTDGTKGIDLTFTEFAEVFGVYDILNSSSAQTGTISDMYII